MPDIEFVGPSAQNADHIQANTSKLVNLYREPVGPGGRTSYILRPVPATETYKTLDDLFIRDMRNVGGTLYVLNGSKLRSIAPSGVVADLGDITGAPLGHLFGETGGVGLVSGGRYQVWDGTTLSEPDVTPFIPATGNVGSGAYLNGYTILTEKNARTFAWSGILDPKTFPGTNIATIEATEDKILRVIAFNGQLWFFKENSSEIWYLTGQAGANAFARVPGGVVNTGLKSEDLVTVLRDVLMWVGSDGIVYLSDGQGSRPISTPAVNRNIANEQVDRCFAYEQEGHKFLAIRYRGRPADVFDIASAEWHERASGPLQNAWTPRASANFGGDWYVGADTGDIYKLGSGSVDADGPLICEATSATLKIENRLTRLAEAEIYADMAPLDQSNIPGDDTVLLLFVDGAPDGMIEGTEIIDGDDYFDFLINEERSPKIEMSLSGDYGRTWGPYRTASLGRVGQYDNRVIFRALGQYRQITVRIRVSDNVKRAINSRMTVRTA